MTDTPIATLRAAEPQLFTTDIRRAADYFAQKPGFRLVFLYGDSPFYGQVARDGTAVKGDTTLVVKDPDGNLILFTS